MHAFAGRASGAGGDALDPLASPLYADLSGLPPILIQTGGAEVLRDDGAAIAGLYAAGNDRASMMGGNYPGAGITLGPHLVFGYLLAGLIVGLRYYVIGPATHHRPQSTFHKQGFYRRCVRQTCCLKLHGVA